MEVSALPGKAFRLPGRRSLWLVMLVVGLGRPVLLCGDTIGFVNGDCLSGTVLSAQDGRLEFESTVLGKVCIATETIQSLVVDMPLPVLLTESPRSIEACLGTEEGVLMLDDGIAPRPIEWDSIRALGSAAQELAPMATPGQKFTWHGAAEAGLSGRSGTVDRLSSEGKLTIEGFNDQLQLNGYLAARYSEEKVGQEQIRTDDEILFGGLVQSPIDEFLSTFIEGDFERDLIEELRLRSTVDGGLVTHWLKSPTWTYETRQGLGFQHEQFEDDTSQSACIAKLSSELRWKFNSHIDLCQQTQWIPNIRNTEEYRIKAETAATMYLNHDQTLFFKSGLKHEYDNQPVSQVEHLDTYYFSNLGFKF